MKSRTNGYVVFDLLLETLLVINISRFKSIRWEAIYLTTDSTVSVASTGVANTGIKTQSE